MRVISRASVNDERGVVAIAVILLSVGLFGAAALAIDVGAVLMTRRQMVTASDAAALAAAARCAENGSNQYIAALDTAHANIAEADPVGAVTCDSASKSVTVSYETSRALAFAPIVGIDTSTITTQATAIWRPALNAVPLPLVMGAESSPCVSTQSPALGTSCSYWFTQDSSGASGNWGFVDLSSINDTAKCGGGSHSVVSEIYDNETIYELNATGGTPVCRSTGDPKRLWEALATQIGTMRAFPVIEGSVIERHAFPIVGFAPLRIDQVWDARSDFESAVSACGLPPTESHAQTCVVASWQGGQIRSGSLGSGADYGVRSIRLES